MKNIIIAGPSRAGKTTLAKKLSDELKCFVISLDKLVAIFQCAYPQLDIKLNWNRGKTTDNLAPFIGHFLGTFSSDSGTVNELNLNAHFVIGNRFVMEGAYFDFDKICNVLKMYDIKDLKDKFHLIGLTQNNKSVDKFVADFREHDTEDDWTYGFSEDELLKYVTDDAIPFSNSMTEHLKKHGFTIYDTSFNREKVFDKIVKDIVAEQG